MRSLLTVLAALVLAPAAAAADISTPKMDAVASWAAGKPVAVHCESDRTEWTRILASVGHTNPGVPGFAYVGGSTVYIGPVACYGLSSTVPQLLGPGLNILLHEATHARGWRDEALTECAARVLIYSALDRFYGVPFFSRRMRAVVDAALTYSLSKGSEYQNGCDRL